ncbi:MAG: hypothetical protein EOP13_02955 [Pseudomonas sp.]|nr:MAG: hypothetical protein EOP13_02955 [Pseudomonas sp.]
MLVLLEKIHVGVSLLAKTVFQPLKIWRMYRPLREQARSHICPASASGMKIALHFPPLPATLSPPRVR